MADVSNEFIEPTTGMKNIPLPKLNQFTTRGAEMNLGMIITDEDGNKVTLGRTGDDDKNVYQYLAVNHCGDWEVCNFWGPEVWGRKKVRVNFIRTYAEPPGMTVDCIVEVKKEVKE